MVFCTVESGLKEGVAGIRFTMARQHDKTTTCGDSAAIQRLGETA
jgi:hypothetical protein